MKEFEGEVIQINSEKGIFHEKDMDPISLISVFYLDVRRADALEHANSIVRLHCTDSRLKLKDGIKVGDIVVVECSVFDEQLIGGIEQSLLVSIAKAKRV